MHSFAEERHSCGCLQISNRRLPMQSITFSLVSLSFGLMALVSVSIFRGNVDLIEIELSHIGKLKIVYRSRQPK
jgi:hypothetical protein